MSTQPSRHFARQPIVDRIGRTLGFEVLFRADSQAADAVILDAGAATRAVLASLETLASDFFGGVPAFVNLSRRSIVDRVLTDLDPARIAVEVLEDVAGDPAVIEALDELRSSGFTVALDDFRPDSARLELLDYADIVKLDIQDFGLATLASLVRDLHHHGLLVLAEKVESMWELNVCLTAGFDLFQGFAIGVPRTVCVAQSDTDRLWRPTAGRQAVAPISL